MKEPEDVSSWRSLQTSSTTSFSPSSKILCLLRFPCHCNIGALEQNHICLPQRMSTVSGSLAGPQTLFSRSRLAFWFCACYPEAAPCETVIKFSHYPQFPQLSEKPMQTKYLHINRNEGTIYFKTVTYNLRDFVINQGEGSMSRRLPFPDLDTDGKEVS